MNYPETLAGYDYVSNLGNNDKVQLLCKSGTLELFVFKQLEYYDLSIYRFLQKIDNPHFPHIYQLYEENQVLYVLEEFISGNSLEDYMKWDGYYTEEKVCAITREICEAMLLLHHAEPPIVHRDLKPENIMMSSEGILKIIDFDAARMFSQNESRDTVVMGTRAFAAPEQFGYSQTDPRSDIYALGVLMNYLLTGHGIKDGIYSGALSTVIGKAAAFDPVNRYQKLEELYDALKMPQEEKAPEKSKKSVSLIPPGFRTRKMWKMILAAIGYLLILLVGLRLEMPMLDGGEPNMASLWWNRICFMLIPLGIVFLIFNYGNIHSRLPFVRKNKGKKIWCVIYAIIYVLLILFLLVAIEHTFLL